MGNRDDEYDYLFKGKVRREKILVPMTFFLPFLADSTRFLAPQPHSKWFISFVSVFLLWSLRDGGLEPQRICFHSENVCRHHFPKSVQLKGIEKKTHKERENKNDDSIWWRKWFLINTKICETPRWQFRNFSRNFFFYCVFVKWQMIFRIKRCLEFLIVQVSLL